MKRSAPRGAKPGERLPRGETRRKLVEAALDLFSTRAYEEVTVGEIAAAAGVAHGLLFHYFDSKRGLYLASLDEAARQLNVAHETDVSAAPGARVRELLTKHLHHLAAHRDLALNLILRGGNDPEASEMFEADRWKQIRWVCDVLDLDPDNAAIGTTMRAFGAAADDATLRWLQDGQPHQVAAMVEALVEILVGSLHAASRLDPALETRAAIGRLRRPGVSRRTA